MASCVRNNGHFCNFVKLLDISSKNQNTCSPCHLGNRSNAAIDRNLKKMKKQKTKRDLSKVKPVPKYLSKVKPVPKYVYNNSSFTLIFLSFEIAIKPQKTTQDSA